jgi:ribosomal protein S15P/S13E
MATEKVIETDAIVGENTLEQDIIEAIDGNEELSSDDVTEAASEVAGTVDGEATDSLDAPDYWDDERKEAFEGLPTTEAKESFISTVRNLERGYQKKFDNIADISKEYDQIVGIMQPFDSELSSRGQTRTDAIRNLVSAQQLLTQNPAQGLSQLVQQFGGQQAQAIVQQLAQQYGVSTQEASSQAYADPEIQALQSQVSLLTNHLQQNENNALSQRTMEARNQIDLFAEAQDESGNKLHPHFSKVEQVMGKMITQGIASDMDDAYDRAVYQEPSIRSELISGERENVAASFNATRKAVNAKSKSASKNVKTNNVAPENAPAEPDDIRASIAKAMAEYG